MPETSDSEFTWKDYQAKINNELVANLGNFVNRIFVLTNKFYNGVVPDVIAERLSDIDKTTLKELKAQKEKIENATRQLQI